tara:strand:+ start:1236 stop:1670 length:435 start_codon:yes stop_codon:yes gene_type:complete
MGMFKDCGCGCNGRKQQDKFLTSVISGLTFFIVANPETFRLVRRILGPSIATPNGCPSNFGLVVHAIVFTLIVWGMMNVKKEGGKKGCGCKGKRKGNKVVMSAPPDMVDAPNPKPDFGEPQINFHETGRVLEPMNEMNEDPLFN